MANEPPDVSVFQSSVVRDPEAGDFVPQSRMLDPSSYRDTTVPGYDENDFQSHRNVYVAVHVPYQSKHKHRHKKKHSGSSGSLHHGNGRSRHGNGHGRHSEGSIPLQGGVEPDRVSEPGGRVHFEKKTHTKFHKSISLPDNKPTQHQDVNVPPVILEPCTPSDPCDRVKFILGEDETDHPSHEPCTHTIFSELEELKYNENDTMEWKETARWVKFEEDVEEGGNKWSKPHVATLSLHSLFELRSCILKGTVLLDLHAENLAQIADYVLDQLVRSGELEEDCRERVRSALLQRHRHLNSKKEGQERKILEHIRSLGDIGRLNSNTSKHLDPELAGTSSSSVPGSQIPSRRNSFLHGNGGNSTTDGIGNGNGTSVANSLRNGSLAGVEEEKGNSDQDLANLRKHNNICKKLPPGSEASNVLVGEVDFLSHPVIAFVRLAQGQYLGDLTEVPIPTRFLFIMLGPKGNQERYHEIGRSIATLMSDEVFHDVAYKARNRGDLLAGVDEFLDKVTVLPPGEWDPQIRLEPPDTVPSQANRRGTIVPEKQKEIQERKKSFSTSSAPPVKWSKKPFGGFIDDVLKCYFVYRSDFRDAFSLQGLASLILIFFANLTLAFTFGAFLSDVTKGTLGTTEMILAVGIGNLVFSVFSGQPLVILGATGPTIIFEQILFNFCDSQDISFLNFRFWIGMWTALFMIILVAFNTSAVMRLFTRFTEEIFTALVSFVFIYEAFAKLWQIHVNFPYNEWILYPTKRRSCDCYQFLTSDTYSEMNMTNATFVGSYWEKPNCSKDILRRYVGDGCPTGNFEDVFLMSVILFFGTFLVCIYLKMFRSTKFLRGFIRRLVSDFAVFIAVVVWVGVDVLAQVDTPKPPVPNVFQSGVFTKENRTSLFIKPLGNDLPKWAPAGAIIPALLATILLFVDQHITALIVNRKDNKLKKGPGYHLDMLIVGLLIFLHSALGLPWVVGATVVSISHVQSLFLFSTHTAPGERPKFLGVREQRVTLFFMAILVALSVMAYPVLQLLPLPVLYGLLLFLGISSLSGIQFMKRIKLFFVPNKYKPDCKYYRHIPTHRIHAYTIIQIVFLVLLIVFQVVTQLKVVFPLIVLTLVLGRYLLGFIFSKHDLELLDEPIPDKLYCKRFRTNETSKNDQEGSVEDGLAESEEGTDGPTDEKDHTATGHPSASDNNNELEEVVVTSEPVSGEEAYNARNPLFRANSNNSRRGQSFNISQEVNKCDLWKNMMKKLDAPPPSPRKAAKYRSKSPSVLAARQVLPDVKEGSSMMDDQPLYFSAQESYDSVRNNDNKPSVCRKLYQSTSV